MPNGRVTAIDPDRGLGTVTADDGTEYPFHVVEIADGTRTIDLGQPVTFRLLPRFGRYEAGHLVER